MVDLHNFDFPVVVRLIPTDAKVKRIFLSYFVSMEASGKHKQRKKYISIIKNFLRELKVQISRETTNGRKTFVLSDADLQQKLVETAFFNL